MSIATKRGDAGQTGLVGGVRVSKAALRVEAYGSVDELNSVLGFARSICQNADIRAWTESIQKTLFRLGSALATQPETKNPSPAITAGDVEQLTTLVHTIEATKGILSDSSLPGSFTEAAVFEMARTVCRRAERNVVQFSESGAPVDSQVLAYLNHCQTLCGSSDGCWNSTPESIPVYAMTNTRVPVGRGPGDATGRRIFGN